MVVNNKSLGSSRLTKRTVTGRRVEAAPALSSLDGSRNVFL